MPAANANLLLVEDDVQLRILFTAILMHSGYRVRVAADGFSALTEVRAEMPDVILSDLYMLGMSGFELLSVIRRRFPQIIVVAMSSAFSGGEIPTGVAADAFYQKATSIVDLLNIVQETLSAGGSQLVRRLGQSTPIWVATHPARSADDDTLAPSQVTVPGERARNCSPSDLATTIAREVTSVSTPVTTVAALGGRWAQNSCSRPSNTGLSKTAARSKARLALRAEGPETARSAQPAQTCAFRRTCPPWDCDPRDVMSDDAHIRADTSSDSAISVSEEAQIDRSRVICALSELSVFLGCASRGRVAEVDGRGVSLSINHLE